MTAIVCSFHFPWIKGIESIRKKKSLNKASALSSDMIRKYQEAIQLPRLASRLHAPAPEAASVSKPPTMAMFLKNISC